MLSLTKENFSFKSSNGVNTINGIIVRKPQPPYKAIVQISHGMKEHIGRYQEYMEYMANQGYVMVAHDHLGHGKSVDDSSQYGYFAEKDGYLCVLNDIATVSGRVKKSFPQLKLFLLGHSMGSFYARVFAAKYSYLADGIIISGTGGSNPLAIPGKILIDLLIKIKGEKATSKFVTKIIFGSYLKRIEKPKTASDWLTTDQQVVEKYRNDPACRFYFTLSGYKDLVKINSLSNTKECFDNTNKEISYLIFSGDMDPVSEWGKKIVEVYNNYKKALSRWHK